MQFYLLSALIFSLLVAIFAVQNTEQVMVKFFVFTFPIPLVLVILGSAAVGALAVYFLGFFKAADNKKKSKRQNENKSEKCPEVNSDKPLQDTEKSQL